MNLRNLLSSTILQRAPVGVTTGDGAFTDTGFNTGGWSSLIFPHEGRPGYWQRDLTFKDKADLMAVSAVYACAQIISGDMAKLPIKIWRRLATGGREEHLNHPANSVLWSPNHYQTRLDFIQQLMVSVLLTGNAYVLIERDARNFISSLYVLDPSRVQVLIDPTGNEVYYRIGEHRLADVYSSITVPASEIIHHRVMCADHPLQGIPPLYAAASAGALGSKILAHSKQFFSNQSRPGGLLVAPGKLTPKEAEDLKKRWESMTSKENMGRVAVLTNGLKWETLTMKAVDAELARQFEFSVEDIARAFRVPEFMLGRSSVTYKNSEQQQRTYYSGCLQYHIESLQIRLDKAFELANDVELNFELEALLRTEMDARYAAYRTGIQAGFLTINEARAKEDMAPIDGAGEPLVQMQYVPLSQLKKMNDAKLAPPMPPQPKLPAPTPSGVPRLPVPAAPRSAVFKDEADLELSAIEFEDAFQRIRQGDRDAA